MSLRLALLLLVLAAPAAAQTIELTPLDDDGTAQQPAIGLVPLSDSEASQSPQLGLTPLENDGSIGFQDIEIQPLDDGGLLLGPAPPTEEVQRDIVVAATTATLRALDKHSAQVADLTLNVGESGSFGHLSIMLDDCRVPQNNPSGDAYAYLEIRDARADRDLFAGWMIASSPALNPLEHPRYDVWVIRCNS